MKANEGGNTINILYIYNNCDYAETIKTFIEQENDQLKIETASSVSDGLNQLADTNFTAVVCDYNMSEQNGIEVLKTVRKDYPDLPFILCTGKGSEDVASDAISAGVTEYVQKDTTKSHFKVFANRIETVVEGTRSEQQHEKLVEAIETANEGIATLDADGYHLSVNQAYADIYGTTPQNLVGKHLDEICPESESEYVRKQILSTVKEKGYWSGQITGIRADSTTFTQECILSTTETSNIIHTVQEISDGTDSEKQLSRYQALIEVLRDPVYVLDEAGKFEFVNDAFIDKFGYENHELLGANISVIKNQKAIEQGRNNLGRILSSDGPESVYFETKIQAKNGDTIPCEDHMTALPYKGEEFEGSVGILRDISKQKERERELERQNKQLDDFAHIVSHDLRNPINVAEGNLKLLQEECDSERIDKIQRSLTRMRDLIDDLLNLSRVGDDINNKIPVNIKDISEDCWGNVETTNATKQISGDFTVQADRSRLAQLFENLIRNAIEHNEQDVTITVGKLADGFYIEDDGTGIPEEDRDDVFEAGYTTAKNGTGFGLSIINQVVKAHGWKIDIKESSAGGARFEITNVDFGST